MTRTDIILERLGMRITRRRGSRAWAVCPFHQDPDRDPIGWGTTFFVRTDGPRRGNYHCFACHESGSLVSLVMKIRSCKLEEARDFVREAGEDWKPPKARLRIVRRAPQISRPRFRFPEEVVRDELARWDTLPRRYAEERGITPEEVARHRIGFAVEGRLAGRIVFPVSVGAEREIVSYSARTFTDEEPRYLTPHESEGPDLDAIFGEDLWPPLEERDVIVVTEGAIDMLAAARTTQRVAGAIGGSNARPAHVVSLATFRRVILLTDPDEPGEKAARTIRMGLGRHARTERVLLPRGCDAAKLAKKDPARLRKEIEQAIERVRMTG